jgi:hypothetical protein
MLPANISTMTLRRVDDDINEAPCNNPMFRVKSWLRNCLGVAAWQGMSDNKVDRLPVRRYLRRLAWSLALSGAVAPVALIAFDPGLAQDSYHTDEATTLPALPAPQVSPDRIGDIREIRADIDPFPKLDDFAWRAFIALNWPSLTAATQRGLPDRSKSFGAPGPRVWETFKARYELYQVGRDGRRLAPPPWASGAAINPCGPGFKNDIKTLATFEPFMDFNQPVFAAGVAGNPLVAQNGTYTRYETRLNQLHYEALARPGWSQGKNLPTQDKPARIAAGSIVVKAAWRVLTEADTPAIRARYYVVQNADVIDIAKSVPAGRTVCSKSDVALVGLHIVIRTKLRPQGIWSSFEHIDNVPAVGRGVAREPDAKDAGMPYAYFDTSKPTLGLWPEFGAPEIQPVSLRNPPRTDPAPMQVVRRHPIHPSTMATNRAYWARPEIKGTIWQNYMLVANQWPTFTHPVGPRYDGVFYPASRKENLVNTTMETYFQDAPSNCMSCHHHTSNVYGRDFVGILNPPQ